MDVVNHLFSVIAAEDPLDGRAAEGRLVSSGLYARQNIGTAKRRSRPWVGIHYAHNA
jgi:hypothetical protein